MHKLHANVHMVTAFHDADPMGIVYHGNYFKYFEEARRLLMAKLNYGYREMAESGYTWPVIDTQVKYIKAIPFNSPIEVSAVLDEWEHRLRVKYTIVCGDSGKVMTRAHTTQVAVETNNDTLCFVSPPCLIRKVEDLLQHENNNKEIENAQ